MRATDLDGVVRALAESGWAVIAGQRFRIDSPPAIRVRHATLNSSDTATFVQVWRPRFVVRLLGLTDFPKRLRRRFGDTPNDRDGEETCNRTSQSSPGEGAAVKFRFGARPWC